MKTTSIVIIGVFGLVAAPQLFATQSQPRTIPFSFSVPIADRLMPGDSKVTVQKAGSGDIHVSAGGFMDTANLRRQLDVLAKADAIAVIETTNSKGVLVENGTWINTVTTASVVDTIKSVKPLSSILDFSVDNGSAVINGVTVQAGFYPIFSPQSRLLVFLSFRASCSCWGASEGYSVDSSGRLAAVPTSGPMAFSMRRAMIGVPLTEVLKNCAAVCSREWILDILVKKLTRETELNESTI